MTTGQAPAQPSDDQQELEAEIAETRERLGDAVEQLVAKLDVKSQARASAGRLAGQLTTAARQARDKGTAKAREARDKGTAKAREARVKGTAKARHARSQASGQAAARPVPLAAAGGLFALLAVLVAVVLRRRKR